LMYVIFLTALWP